MSAQLHVLDEAVIRTRLVGVLRHWRYEGGHLLRLYRTSGWRATMLMTNAIAHLAEQSWHHPDLEVSYARVMVRLTTHDLGGVSERDLQLARRIEELMQWQPDAHSALEGVPADQALISSDD